jgi:hypothetical protein
MTNILWIGANILFDLETGKTTQVLLVVNREEDATTFSREDAGTYLSFVKRRAAHINWSLEPSKDRPEYFVVRGIQNA